MLRRLARVCVGQRLDVNVRKFLLDLLRDPVHEVDKRAGLRAFLLGEFRTFLALAIIAPVVLTDREERRVRLPSQVLLRVFHELVEHFLVREAKLGVVARPFAVHLAVPLGMRVKVLRRREDRVKTVHEMTKLVVVSQFRRNVLRPVIPDLGRKSRVPIRPVEGVAVHEFRRVLVRKPHRDLNRFGLRDRFAVRHPEAAAEYSFEELVHGVERSALRVARQNEIRADRLKRDPVVADFGLVERLPQQFLRKSGRPQNDSVSGLLRVRFRNNGKLHARDLGQVFLKLLRRRLLDRGRLGRQNDPAVRSTTGNERHHLRGFRRNEGRKNEKKHKWKGKKMSHDSKGG